MKIGKTGDKENLLYDTSSLLTAVLSGGGPSLNILNVLNALWKEVRIIKFITEQEAYKLLSSSTSYCRE